MTDVLVLHPGEMGASLGHALIASGHCPHWVSSQRSEQTHRRAKNANLIAQPSLKQALDQVEAVISVCPPEFALDVGQSVLNLGFQGLYCDANAIAPGTAQHLAKDFGESYVDGGIVGPPARRQGSTRLYLSGSKSQEICSLFEGSVLDARVIEGPTLAASAIKMCYAAYTKGSSAMLLAIRALAASHGVTEVLRSEWDISQPSLWDRSERTGPGTTRKAWRFAPEMQEIAKTFHDEGLPSGFHQAAAEVYSRMASLKDSEPVSTATIVDLITTSESS